MWRLFGAVAVLALSWCAVLLFLSPPIMAADLSAPIEQKITVGSEMHRRSNVTFDCERPLSHGAPPAPWADFTECIHRDISDEIRRNTWTEPFQLGLYSGAYMHLQIARNIELKFHNRDLRNGKIFVGEQNLYFHETQFLKQKLGLGDDDICKGIADDEHRPTATCSAVQKAMLADPAITPSF